MGSIIISSTQKVFSLPYQQHPRNPLAVAAYLHPVPRLCSRLEPSKFPVLRVTGVACSISWMLVLKWPLLNSSGRLVAQSTMQLAQQVLGLLEYSIRRHSCVMGLIRTIQPCSRQAPPSAKPHISHCQTPNNARWGVNPRDTEALVRAASKSWNSLANRVVALMVVVTQAIHQRHMCRPSCRDQRHDTDLAKLI